MKKTGLSMEMIKEAISGCTLGVLVPNKCNVNAYQVFFSFLVGNEILFL